MLIKIILLIVILVLSLYIILKLHYIKKNEQQREIVLNRVLEGNYNSRLLIKKSSIHSETDFLINRLIEEYQSQIIKMNNNEIKRKQLLSNISHDIRTPLTAIIGYLDATNTAIVSSEEEKENYINIANKRARQLKIILDDIFELAKANSNELPLNKKMLNIKDILTDTIIEYIPILEGQEINLINNISDLDVYIYADEYCIIRILENLLNNAITHGKDGKVIGIDTYVVDREYCIEIWDKGIGIEEDIEKIFLRLYKKDLNNSTNGLGLAISKTLVERNEGRIEVNSLPNKKTSFMVCLNISKITS